MIHKDVRIRAGMRDGDNLALVSWSDTEGICCLSLIRADNLSLGVSGVLHSLLTDED